MFFRTEIPEESVQVTCVASGVLELRAPDAWSLHATKPPSTPQSDDSF
jgi:hypothetical protein